MGTESQSRRASREVSERAGSGDPAGEVKACRSCLFVLERELDGDFHDFAVPWLRGVRLLFRAPDDPDIPLQELRSPPIQDLGFSTREHRRLGGVQQMLGTN